MSLYRSAQTRRSIVFYAKRSVLTAVGILVCLFFMTAMTVVSFGRSELACSRTNNLCILEELRAFGVWKKGQLLELKTIQRAMIHESIDDTELALVIGGNIKPLGTLPLIGTENDRTEWVAQVNSFLNDPTQTELRVSYGRTWPTYALMFVSALALLLWLRARDRYVIEPAHRELRIEKRILRTRVRTIPFDQIKEAVIDMQEDIDGKQYAAALKFTNDTLLPLDDYSGLELAKKEELVAQINQALEDAGKR